MPGLSQLLHSPARNATAVGEVVVASEEAIERALARAALAQPAWDRIGAHHRAACLERVADLMEAQCHSLIGLIVAEAGRTIDDALSEVREAIDFCRYYAQQARAHFCAPQSLPGPTGEVKRKGRIPVHQPLEFSVGYLCGASLCSAGRREFRDCQAGRTNTADSISGGRLIA